MKFLFSCSILLSFFSGCYAFEKLTILTQSPIIPGGWGGHPAVNGSLARGLPSLNISYNWNPQTIDEIGDVVYVPTNTNALKTAIDLKQHGKIHILLAGPNLVGKPTCDGGIVTHSAIDRYIVNSEWTKTFYANDAPSLSNRLSIWPAGVDTKFWNPSNSNKESKYVLVYQKNQSESFCQQVEHSLRKYGWQPIRITYGSYDHNGYKNMLNQARFAVFLSKSESQGIALAECWSMDVPTLVWDIQQPLEYLGARIWPVSPAPFLTSDTGQFWHSIHDLEELLQHIEETLTQTKPRSWVLENMSDEVCAQILLNIINDIELTKNKTM